MSWWRLGTGSACLAVGLVLLVGTRWAMRRGDKPIQQVALLAPLTVGLAALVGGVGLVLTACLVS